MRKVKLTKESTKDILETLLKRSPNNYGKYEDAVANARAEVQTAARKVCPSYSEDGVLQILKGIVSESGK